MNSPEYTHIAPVIFTEIDSGDFVRPSVMPASTNPQFATGPLQEERHAFHMLMIQLTSVQSFWQGHEPVHKGGV